MDDTVRRVAGRKRQLRIRMSRIQHAALMSRLMLSTSCASTVMLGIGYSVIANLVGSY